MKYRSKLIIEATQWFENGDHPFDDIFRSFEDTGVAPTEPREGQIVRYFRHPKIAASKQCEDCGLAMYEHGWLDNGSNDGRGETICPGDYILEIDSEPNDPDSYTCAAKGIFESQYELV